MYAIRTIHDIEAILKVHKVFPFSVEEEFPGEEQSILHLYYVHEKEQNSIDDVWNLHIKNRLPAGVVITPVFIPCTKAAKRVWEVGQFFKKMRFVKMGDYFLNLSGVYKEK